MLRFYDADSPAVSRASQRTLSVSPTMRSAHDPDRIRDDCARQPEAVTSWPSQGRRGGARFVVCRGYEPGPSSTRCSTAPDEVRPHYRAAARRARRLTPGGLRGAPARGRRAVPLPGHHLHRLQRSAEGIERIFPFDLVPRMIPRRGVGAAGARPGAARHRAQPVPARRLPRQRIICRKASVAAELVFGARHFRREMIGFRAAGRRVRPRIGTDLVRDGAGRATSCSRTTCARPRASATCSRTAQAMKRDLPAAVRALRRAAGRALPAGAARARCARSRPHGSAEPRVVLLTPGVYNSAYFEHSFLARQMGIELVEGRDLVVARQPRLHAHDPRPAARST